MKNLKFVFVLVFLICTSGISYAQCITDMNIEKKPLTTHQSKVVYTVNVEFDDSGSNYLLIHRTGENSPSKRCDESPCSKTFLYTRKEQDKYREIALYSSDCNEFVGCIVLVDGL